MHAPLVRPVLDARDQALADWILLHVKPLLALAVAQAMMPAARLKLPTGVPMLPAKLTFPVGDPGLDGELQVARRAEAMQVIRHQEIIADQPRRRFEPGLMDELLRLRADREGKMLALLAPPCARKQD